MSKIRYRSGKPVNKKYGRHSVRMSTPSWWINLAMTRTQRRRTRRLLDLLQRGAPSALDEPVFPLAKKPHVYFW